jgi:hypothetical protein
MIVDASVRKFGITSGSFSLFGSLVCVDRRFGGSLGSCPTAGDSHFAQPKVLSTALFQSA